MYLHIRSYPHVHAFSPAWLDCLPHLPKVSGYLQSAELQQIQDPELGRGPSVNQWGNVGQLLLRPGVQQILDCQIVHLDIQILGCREENIQKGWDKLGWFSTSNGILRS